MTSQHDTGQHDTGNQRGQQEPSAESRLHDMGGDIGPASIRGSGVAPGGQHDDQAEPASGFSEPMGYMAGRDDDWAVTAGSDEKAVAARTDQVAGDEDTFGPSPQATPEDVGGRPTEPGRPGYRVRGPVDEREHGVVDEPDPDPDDPDAAAGVTAVPAGDGGHVTGTLGWSDDDGDDPDAGSGRVWE